MRKFVLAADIGATKTNLGLFHAMEDGLQREIVINFKSCGEDDFIDRAKAFVAANMVSEGLAAVCFGVAGPVINGEVVATNLGLKLKTKDLRREFGCDNLCLVNDLFATAAAVSVLDDSDFVTLQPGNHLESGTDVNAAIMAPGTGLGMAFIVDGQRLEIISSEGGHADFAPRNEVELSLWRYFKRHFDRVSRERLLSGLGLVHIFTWLRQCRSEGVSEVTASWSSIPDVTAAEVVTAADSGDDLACEALALFTSILGGVAGDLALTGMTAGGLYLAGGIPAKIIRYLRQGQFLTSFNAKGRMSSWMEGVPVKIILNSEAALLGAARIARERYRLSG